MTRQHALKSLMLELLYPAVLGAVIYSALDVAILPWIEGHILGSEVKPLQAEVPLQLILLFFTVVFYCIDYLYVMFTSNYDRFFFVCDLAFLVVLYVTVAAIGLSGVSRHSPNLKVIIGCYCIFLFLYFIWDLFEKYRCKDTAESRWYGKILGWEIYSFVVLIVLTFTIHWISNAQCAGIVVAIVIGLITARFARLTWQKKRFYKEALE